MKTLPIFAIFCLQYVAKYVPSSIFTGHKLCTISLRSRQLVHSPECHLRILPCVSERSETDHAASSQSLRDQQACQMKEKEKKTLVETLTLM